MKDFAQKKNSENCAVNEIRSKNDVQQERLHMTI